MKAPESNDARRAGVAQNDWAGIGWTDSSWELAHGLEVVEGPPGDEWSAVFSSTAARLTTTEPVLG